MHGIEDLSPSRPLTMLGTNRGGALVNFGDIVVLNGVNDRGFTTTTTPGLSSAQAAVVYERHGILPNESGRLAIGGWIPQINLGSIATPGQFIRTHSVAGKGNPHAGALEGDFAVALSGGATPEAALFGNSTSSAVHPNLTAPVQSDFSWVNQGTASEDTTIPGTIYLNCPAASGGGLRIRDRALPAASGYTITIGFNPLLIRENFMTMGIILRDSVGAGLVSLGLDVVVGGLSVVKWTNPTTFNLRYLSAAFNTPDFIYMRFVDDGANRLSQISIDGVHYFQVHSVGRTDFITPDRWGYFGVPDNATFGCAMTLRSVSQSTP